MRLHSEAGMGAADAVLALAIGLAVMGVGAAVVHDRQEALRVQTAGAWINDLGYAAQVYARQHFDGVYQAAGSNGLVIRTDNLDQDPDGNGPLPALGTYLRNAVADDALGNQARVVFRRGGNANQIQVVVLSDLNQEAIPAARSGDFYQSPGIHGLILQKDGAGWQASGPRAVTSGDLDSLVTAQQRHGVQLAAITADTRGYGYAALVLKDPAPAVALFTPPVAPPSRQTVEARQAAAFGTFRVVRNSVFGPVFVGTTIIDQGGGRYLVSEGGTGPRATATWVPSKIVLQPGNRAEVWK